MVLHHGTPSGSRRNPLRRRPRTVGRPTAPNPRASADQKAAQGRRGGRGDLLDGVAPAGHLPVLGLPLRFQGGRRQDAYAGARAARSPRSRRASPSSASSCSICSTASSAPSSRSAARPPSRPRTGTGRASRAASSSTSRRSRPRSSTCTTPSRSPRRSSRRPRRRRVEKEKEMGTELLLRVFRHFYLEEIDRQWVDHLTNMEHLRDGIGLRGYGQRDPKQEYKKEGYDVFVTMMAATSSNVCSKLFKVQVPQGDGHRAHRARGRREARGAAARDADAARRESRRGARRRPRSLVRRPPDPAAGHGAAGAARGAEDRPQRPVPVR